VTLYEIILCALYGVKRIYTELIAGPERFMDIVDQFNATVVFFVPMLINSFKASKNLRTFDKVRTVISGGMTITTEFISETVKIFPSAKIYCAYASTEGDVITLTKNGLKSWSSGQTNDGYQIKVRCLINKIV
jgi:acyl-coenzyme A synthetase/AMP-(fatty) acid ligase